MFSLIVNVLHGFLGLKEFEIFKTIPKTFIENLHHLLGKILKVLMRKLLLVLMNGTVRRRGIMLKFLCYLILFSSYLTDFKHQLMMSFCLQITKTIPDEREKSSCVYKFVAPRVLHRFE